MDNMGCLNTKSQNDLITNYIAQYPHMIDSGKRNDLSVNSTEHDLTDSNYNFMREVSGQTETKVIYKPGMNSTIYNYAIANQQWHKLLNKVKT